MSALIRIREAGFKVILSGDAFDLSPCSLLSLQQREFIKSHKSEILGELKRERLTVICYAPAGVAFEIDALNEEHAVWLIKMNPRPKEVLH